jgi:hypothetical protein
MMYGSLVRKRENMIGELTVLRSRHRKRKGILKILVKLTTMQLRKELKGQVT